VSHAASDGTYGAPRVTADLREAGERVNRKRVARVMRRFGVQGLRLRRRTTTTISDPAAAKASDLIGRDFTAKKINQRYVGDITYLPVGDRGFLYLATVIDLHSRRLAGWAIADHMRTELVLDALAAAERTRGSLDGAIMHTDHGGQYTSKDFAAACKTAGVRQSMSAVGSSADNALAESFNASFKRETPARPAGVQRRTRRQVEQLPLAAPLQHRPPALPAGISITKQLREHPQPNGYADSSRINPVSKFRGQAPFAFPEPYTERSPLTDMQRALLRALAANDDWELWNPRNGSCGLVFRQVGLPHDRSACRRLAG
jgi:transposase InsO family protein